MGQLFCTMNTINVKRGKAHHRASSQGQKSITKIITIPLDPQLLVGSKTTEICASATGRVGQGVNTRHKPKPGNSNPSVQVSSASITAFFGDEDYIGLFAEFLGEAKAVPSVLEVLREGELPPRLGVANADERNTQTRLDMSKEFPTRVHQFVSLETNRIHKDGMDHVYFLYHPDVDWHPAFWSLVKRHGFPKRLLGVAHNLDSLVIWMVFIRAQLKRRAKPKDEETTVLHLLIPAHEVTVIVEPLEFSYLGPLTIQGESHGQQLYVWLNLPTIEY